MILAIGLIILVFFLLGAPLFVCLGALAFLLLTAVGIDPQVIAIEIYRITSSPSLVIIPMFAFAGVVMARSGMPARFVELSRALVGWIPGSAAIITLATFEIFTAFTGASGLSILAVGGMLYTVLRQAGYSDRFSLGLVSSAGSLGVLLPPSIVIIFFGTLTQTPIGILFKAGLLPSLVMIGTLGAYCAWCGVRDGTRVSFSSQRLQAALWDSRFELPLPFLVVYGIYSGLITINEVACLTAVYVAVVEVGLYKEVSLRKDLPGFVVEAMMLVGAIVVVLGTALGLTNYFFDQELPQKIIEWSSSVISSRVGFLIALNCLLLVTGCILDVFSALILLVPLVTPLALSHGVHPVHLGIIFLANLEIGYSTPPVGLNLFISSLTFKRPLVDVVRAVLPFIVLLMFAVLIITFVPWLSTWPTEPVDELLLYP